MTEKALTSRLSELLDKHRSSTSLEQGLDCISLLMLLASRPPDTIRKINNMGTVFQVPAIESLCDDLTAELPDEIWEFPEYLNPEFLTDALQLVCEVSDLVILAEALRTLLETSSAGISFIANSNEVTIIKALAKNTTEKIVFDGAAGIARIAANLDSSKLVLQELDKETWKISYRLLHLTEKQFNFEWGNSLSNPQVLPESCDLAIMTPPFGLRLDSSQCQAIKEAQYLLPVDAARIPSSGNESLWIQLALYSLKSTGRALLILPPGWLFRGGYDSKVREYLLEHELIDAVLGLPTHFLDFATIEPVVLVLAKNREKGSPIHFVDATSFGARSQRRHEITTEDARMISDLACGKFPEDPRYRAVHMPEIRRSDNVLSIRQYIQRDEEISLPDLEEAIQTLAEAETAHHQAQEKLTKLMQHARKTWPIRPTH
jgi:type I restriction enzyme M protein